MNPRDRHLGLTHGSVQLSGHTGAPLAFTHEGEATRKYLLEEGTDLWHTSEHEWGSGFVTGTVAARWNVPDELDHTATGSNAIHKLSSELVLRVERSAEGSFQERYVFTNTGLRTLTLDGLGIVTPFRDVYENAAVSLETAVHAHVWTGGANAWVLAQPMSGKGPVLCLRLAEGALHSYSIESRNHFTSSNVRGHIVLQGTDAGRNPEAFGGQPEITLEPGRSHTIAWVLGWEDTVEGAHSTVRETWEPARLSVLVGERVALPGLHIEEVSTVEPAIIEQTAEGVAVSSDTHQIVHVTTPRGLLTLLFHAPLERIVASRARFILEHQRSTQRLGVDADAFVPYDSRSGLTQLTSGWPDWSDGSERVAMPTLLQQARIRRWVGEEVDEPLLRWAEFAKTRLLDSTCAPLWGSNTIITKTRLYNSPWIAHFFADQYRLFGREEDLLLAARILERSYELGAREHLSIGQPESVMHVAEQLDGIGLSGRATALREELLACARHFAAVGADLPSHEVNYEQSMVAPLVSLYATADELSPGEFDDQLRLTIQWMRAFGGPQPHARIKHIGLRHWDGFWFGAIRRWGDVFPHHWSVLSAVALEQLPERFSSDRLREEADQIYRANLANFSPDGAATAAFVLPSTVDGIPGYSADPLANDQDWALTLMLRGPMTGRSSRASARRSARTPGDRAETKLAAVS